MHSVRDVQIALRRRGYDPGPADGIPGRRTLAAIRHFQADSGLCADGIAGSVTLAALFGEAGAKPEPAILVPWFAEASRLMGTREVAGPQHSSVILGWAKALGGWIADTYTADEQAWCGLFVAHCIGATLPGEPLPANPLGARQWQKFGRAIPSPAKGAIAVFWRGAPVGWQGHVGFVNAVSADGKSLQIRGGNQSNRVCDAWLDRSRLLALRWPTSAPLPALRPLPVRAVGDLSTNEA